MAQPQMKEAWLKNVFANIWHFIQEKKPQTSPPPLENSFLVFFFFIIFLQILFEDIIAFKNDPQHILSKYAQTVFLNSYFM